MASPVRVNALGFVFSGEPNLFGRAGENKAIKIASAISGLPFRGRANQDRVSNPVPAAKPAYAVRQVYLCEVQQKQSHKDRFSDLGPCLQQTGLLFNSRANQDRVSNPEITALL